MSSAAGGTAHTAFVVAKVHARLRANRWTVATGESVTGGLVVASLIDAPGASETVRGGIVAYATELKSSLLGVDAELLAAMGPVDVGVAEAMALGARTVVGASVGVGVTGVAGPDSQGGSPVGTVHVACVTPSVAACRVRSYSFSGGRAEVRAQATASALALLAECLDT